MKATTRKKLLLLLASGIGLSLARTPKQYLRVIKETHKTFKEIDKRSLLRSVNKFKFERIVSFKEAPDNTVSIILTEAGKKKALKYKLDDLKINNPRKWDKKWRLVIFDIPEKKKNAREALRSMLKRLGLYQLQRSCFVYPHNCEDEINFVIEMFEIRTYVSIIEATKITNEASLKLKFELE